VVVHQDGSGSRVMVMDPEAALGIVQNPALAEVAREAKSRLQRALEELA